jgi:hypothetical protein
MPETQARQPTPSSALRTLAGWAAFGLVALVFCEIGSRLDDWFFEEVPVFENPSYEAMFTFDENGLRRGIPGSRWKKVALNNLGMRGADVPQKSAGECRRWMFLGASETFGEPSMADAEFPARVRALARQQSRCVDVINTAYPGIAPQGLLRYYHTALRPYAPDVVFVYASTHFYLAEDGPRAIATPAPAASPPAASSSRPPAASRALSLGSIVGSSRFLERLKDSAEVPAMIQQMRLRRWIEAASSGKPANWAFTRVPEERLELLSADLRELVAEIRASGAEPVLMTHAVRVTSPPREEDHTDLYAMRRYVPRASEAVLADFEYRAAETVRKLGAELDLEVIDVARELNGKRDRFIDLVHFSQAGHEDVAKLVVSSMSEAGK